MGNIYGGSNRNYNISPSRLMIDMNSNRFAPIDSKRTTAQERTVKFMSKRENVGDIGLKSGQSKLNSS